MERDSSGVRFPPPLIFAVALTAGFLLQRIWPVGVAPAAWSGALRLVGAAFIVVWAVLSFAAVRAFRRARTSVLPTRPTTLVVETGPYRFTRNPMYVGLTALSVGLALIANALWALVWVGGAVLVLRWAVVAREERYLEAKFGAEYLAYRTRVRRWL